MNKFGLIGISAIVAAAVSFATFKVMEPRRGAIDSAQAGIPSTQLAANRGKAKIMDAVPEFTQAAALVTQSIVHIKVKLNRPAENEGSYGGYYNQNQRAVPVMASGSGVIWSKDGFIVTNNHVVDGATDIEVILTDKRIFPGKLVGRDPNTDLALIKISTNDLTPIQVGNSDDVQIGEWVLAAGYPFSLNTTVTAGIVSAKERSIGIIGQENKQPNGESGTATATSSAVEAYIQTDAAINPGNSGGALVNTSGQLIGINAAIASQTGSYEGYGFAIPVNLTSKIVEDLRKYGEVKRGLLGVSFPSPATEDQFLIQQGIKPGSVNGAYLTGVQSGSAASAAGLKPGDIIQGIDGAKINSSVELSERIARHHPGDAVKLDYRRGTAVSSTKVTLKAQEAAPKTDELVPQALASKLGASFAPLSDAFKQRYQMNTGLAITAIAPGGLFEQIGIQRGSIIISVNGNRINSSDDLSKAFKAARNGIVRFACITPDGSRIVFNLSLGA
ncbi:serine protease Do [Mucilaginibacter sp. UYNi724]